jgi:hypothetical protein
MAVTIKMFQLPGSIRGSVGPIRCGFGFSFAICKTNRSASSSIRSPPTRWRNLDPSNLSAMSFRFQPSSVSGFATAANSSKAFRPSRWAISANVAFSASDNNNLPLNWALRIAVVCQAQTGMAGDQAVSGGIPAQSAGPRLPYQTDEQCTVSPLETEDKLNRSIL